MSQILNPYLLDILTKLVETVTLAFSQEQKFNNLINQFSDKEISKLIQKSPTWFDYYSKNLMPMDIISANANMKAEYIKVSSKPDSWNSLLSDSKETLSTNLVDLDKFALKNGNLTFDFTNTSKEEVVWALAASRAMYANFRAQATYGQSMFSLLQAGINGNDKGFIKAVSIDPTIQSHPAIVERISQSLIAKRNTFFNTLQKAAINGTSKKIEKDHNQLRFILGLLYQMNILQQLTDAQRYQLFCKEFTLYADSGENPKAAVCTFIKRWEENLVF